MDENLSNLLVGILFGASLDLAGFGSAKKLNAQFLLRDFSMFKVMFGAIVAAALIYLLFVESGFKPVTDALIPSLNTGVLLGAYFLGVGLVIGGYCPGTALTAAASGRIDAILFFLMMYPGYHFWIWLEPQLNINFQAPLLESHLTLPDLFGVQKIWILTGLIVLFVLGWVLGSKVEKLRK